jgi:protein-S-isoprenylcysteine O-methyltransferase Ste14
MLMSDALSKGKMLVAAQFVLLGAMLFAPKPASITIPGWAFVTGELLFLGGIVIVALGFRALGTSLTANPVPLETGTLVTTGIYARVRHPIYTGLIVLTLGMVLDSWNPIRLGIWLALVGLLQYKMRFEESMLVTRYPGYAQYMASVPALVPALGSRSS